MKPEQIRKRFIEFYENLGYLLLPKASMVDPSIPMSFVMSAGLVQVETSLSRLSEQQGSQFVLVQDCFRHFDMDKVGTDDIHLSFFEMPGAFAFGLNDKAKAIQRMWQFATSILGIEKEDLWATYFAGGTVLEDYLLEDIETKQAWLDTGISSNRLVGLGPENNYWIQGRGINGIEIRKCGPNTELFFDRGQNKGCSQNCKPGCACGRFIEFSNSLFICFEINSEKNALSVLANPFTETVIGIERVAMILQNAKTVFEIDEYKSIFDAMDGYIIADGLEESLVRSSRQIIADHVRSLYYLVANNAPPPGKDGRARIVKMLIRRVITRLLVLGIYPMEILLNILEAIRENAPQELQQEWIQDRFVIYFRSESKRFLRTIERAKRQLSQYLNEGKDRTLSNAQIVHLEKNMGMPSLLTAMLLKSKNLFQEVDYSEIFGSINGKNVSIYLD